MSTKAVTTENIDVYADWIMESAIRSERGIFAQSVTLNPVLAQALLERNAENRALNENRIATYSTDIEEGRWRANGETIIVSNEGTLNDGQHRCAAVVRTGIAIPALIVFGPDRESRKTTNQGKTKGAGDYASMSGVPNGNVVAGLVRLLVSYEKHGTIMGGNRVTNAQIAEYLSAHLDECVTSARYAVNARDRTKGMVAPSPLSFCYHVSRHINQAAADDYYSSVITGEMLERTDPAYLVRNKLTAIGKAGAATKIEVILHGWNAYRRGEKRTLIKALGHLPEVV